jgi:hypothetical protein
VQECSDCRCCSRSHTFIHASYDTNPSLMLRYHDHTFMLTADTVGGGLLGPYYVTSCKEEHVPPNLRHFGPPQPIIIGDQVCRAT